MTRYGGMQDWAEKQAAPFKRQYFDTELAATAAESAGNRDEARVLRQRAAIIRRHIERLEKLA
jgi:hypothetical protein